MKCIHCPSPLIILSLIRERPLVSQFVIKNLFPLFSLTYFSFITNLYSWSSPQSSLKPLIFFTPITSVQTTTAFPLNSCCYLWLALFHSRFFILLLRIPFFLSFSFPLFVSFSLFISPFSPLSSLSLCLSLQGFIVMLPWLSLEPAMLLWPNLPAFSIQVLACGYLATISGFL